MSNDNLVVYGGAVKALEGGRVEGYLIRFTSPERADLYGEYFDAQTDLYAKDYPIEGAGVLYHHGLDDTLGIRKIGRVMKARIDDAGVWAQAQLDMRDEYEKQIYELAKAGKLGWSSGALPQSVKVDDSGHIKSWAVIEASLTPTPAMPLDTQITTVKALQAHKEAMPKGATQAENGVSDSKSTDSNLAQGAQNNIMSDKKNETLEQQQMQDEAKMEESPMDAIAAKLDEIMAMLAAMGTKADAPMPDEEEMKMAAEEEMKALVKGVKTAAEAASRIDANIGAIVEKAVTAAVSKRAVKQAAVEAAFHKAAAQQEGTSKALKGTGSGMNISVGDNLKYAHLSASDMALALRLVSSAINPTGAPVSLREIKERGVVSDEFLRAFKGKVADEIEDPKAYKTAADRAAIKAAVPFRANELNASDIAGQGLEWVSEFWDTQLWRKDRFMRVYDTLVQKGMMVRELPRGVDTAYFPTEGSDPTVYTVAEANDIDATGRPEYIGKPSPFGTGRVTVTPKELKARVDVTLILEEDSIIAIVPQVNDQLSQSMLEYRDRLAINGDTATSANTNINLIDGTPSALSTQIAPYYLASDGFRKSALGTSGRNRDASGGLSLADYRQTMGLLDGEQRQYKERMLFVIDPDTELATLALLELQTVDVAGGRNTIATGNVPSLYRVDVFSSGFLPLANTAGKVSGTGSNNIRGSILLIYAPYWGFAYKRNITLESQRDITSGTTTFVATMRAGLVARGTNAATITYNVGV